MTAPRRSPTPPMRRSLVPGYSALSSAPHRTPSWRRTMNWPGFGIRGACVKPSGARRRWYDTSRLTRTSQLTPTAAAEAPLPPLRRSARFVRMRERVQPLGWGHAVLLALPALCGRQRAMHLLTELSRHLPEGQVHKAGTLAEHCGLGVGQRKQHSVCQELCLVMSIH